MSYMLSLARCEGNIVLLRSLLARCQLIARLSISAFQDSARIQVTFRLLTTEPLRYNKSRFNRYRDTRTKRPLFRMPMEMT
jgi:hypothetical protein